MRSSKGSAVTGLIEIAALEEYLCRSLAFTLLALALLSILLSGTVPLSSTMSECTMHP